MKAYGITADLADRDQVERVRNELAAQHADANLLVNAAGLFLPKPFLDHDGALELAPHQIRVNTVALAVVATPIYKRFVPEDQIEATIDVADIILDAARDVGATP